MSISAHDPFLCIFHPGALGDGVLALPALRTLRKRFPGHRMVWFRQKELGEVLVAAQEVHGSYSFDSLEILGFNGKSGSNKKLGSEVLNRCERAVSRMNDASGIWKDWILFNGIKKFIFHSPHDSHLRQYHMADRYVERLQPWLTAQQPFNLSAVDIDLESFNFSGELETDCHCARIDVVEQCANSPCLSFPTNTIITTAEKFSYGRNPSPVVQMGMGYFEESPHMPCLE